MRWELYFHQKNKEKQRKVTKKGDSLTTYPDTKSGKINIRKGPYVESRRYGGVEL